MKIIDRYISKNFIKSFLLSLIAFVGIFLVSQLFKVIRYVSDGRFSADESIIYILTMIPKILIDVAPLAVLLGSLMTISSMASNLEIISLKTSGISFKRIILFPVLISLIISGVVFYINDSLYPYALRKNREIKSRDVIVREAPIEKNNAFLRGENGNYIYLIGKINRKTGFAENIEIIDLNSKFDKVERPIEKNNAFLRGENGNYIYLIGKINRKTGFAENIEIIDLNSKFDKVERLITAKEGRYNFSKEIWMLKNANIYDGEKIAKPIEKEIFTEERYNDEPDKFITQNVEPRTLTIKELKKSIRYDGEKIAKPIEKEIFTEERYNDEPDKFITQNVEPRTLTIKELKKSIREIKSVGGDTREFLVELGNRYSFPFASFIISFLGLSLGSRYVRGASAINLALSVALGYGYYIVQASFEALSINGFLNPFIGGWIPNIICLVVGIYFVYRSEY